MEIVKTIDVAYPPRRPDQVEHELEEALSKVRSSSALGILKIIHGQSGTTKETVRNWAHDGGGLLCPRWERYGNLPYEKVEEGQVYTIEPRLTVEGHGIATVEEIVVVTKDGCKFLSKPQKKILVV